VKITFRETTSIHEDLRRKLLRNLMPLRVKKGRGVGSDLLYGQHLHPGGRKFYGQWDNVQPSAQLCYGGRVALGLPQLP
jgi:hypothetical protein